MQELLFAISGSGEFDDAGHLNALHFVATTGNHQRRMAGEIG